MIDFFLLFTPIFFVAFTASAFLMPILLEKLRANAIFDHPNVRSLHALPTPRGGGLAIMAVLLAGFVIGLAALGFPEKPLFLLPALLILIGVSWMDDRKGLGVKIRLAAHFAAAILGQFALPDTQFLGDLMPFWLERGILVVAWVWFLNLYNFMDGIDGITGIETLCILAGAGLLFATTGSATPIDAALVALLAGGTAGFLLFNWPPAKLFLGDVGSIPIGFLLAYFLLKLAFLRPIAALLLPLYYLADSGITIVKRAVRREKIWQPHREHFYQRAASRFGHRTALMWILACDSGLVLTSIFFQNHQVIGFVIGASIVTFILYSLNKIGSR